MPEESQKKSRKKNASPHRPLKPKHPNTEGAPNDHDPNAQYEDKDES
jgi:hypothetical protein